MGFGAAVAGGCSIGNGLVATAALSWQGWIGLAFMIFWNLVHELFYVCAPYESGTTTSIYPIENSQCITIDKL